MSLQLRDKLRLSPSCGEKELREACNRYYRIYKDVEESATDPYVRRIAQSKLADLVASAEKEGITLDGAEEYESPTEEPVFSGDIEAAFSSTVLQGGVISPSQESKLRKMVALLPESAEKHYFTFVLERNTAPMTAETAGKLQAIIQRAISADPDNPVYSRILDDIVKETAAYNDALKKWKGKKGKEIVIGRRRQLIKEIFKFIGSGTVSILGLGLAAAAAIIGCVCECMDC